VRARTRARALAVALAALVATGAGSLTPASGASGPAAAPAGLPVGVPDGAEPSGMAPPGPSGFPGYGETYVTDFAGSSLPPGWSAFNGIPGSDPGAFWSPSHVSVGGGELTLDASRDPAFGASWVAGGACQCARAQTYGAYFVRSRLSGPGATQVELLWPTSGWPPEVDFNETYGHTDFSMATAHYAAANLQVQRTTSVDMTQWHTWGVVWTPTTLTYTVDGRVWGRVADAAAVPQVPMTLHIQQQTWCSLGWACPTTDVQTQVDWVAEYAPVRGQSVIIGPFARGSARLRAPLRAAVGNLADDIAAGAFGQVSVLGFGDTGAPGPPAHTLGLARARSIATALRSRLRSLGASTSVAVTGRPASASLAGRAQVILP
jgi:outer membrane protein OmpA-like peptidoglycan-associated protein